MSRTLLLCLFFLALLNRATFAQDAPDDSQPMLYGSLNVDQKIVLHGTGEQVAALDFESAQGLLVPLIEGEEGPDVAPWEVVLNNSAENVAFGSLLGPAVTVDGSLVTKVGYTGEEPEADLIAEWAADSGEVMQFNVLSPEVIEFSGFVNSDGRIVLVGSGEEVVAYQFRSSEGLLEPVVGGEEADVSPFEHLLSNSPMLVSIGTLGPAVVIDGELTTPVGYAGATPEEELIAEWGADNSPDLNRFTVSGFVCGPVGHQPGDIDGDGEVGFPDFLILSKNFGELGTFEQGDLDCTGDVEFSDFLILSRNFGETTESASAVPEPSSWSLVLVAVLVGGLRLRFRTQEPVG